MNFWITLRKDFHLRPWFLSGAVVLGAWTLTGCGDRQTMASGSGDEQSAAVHVSGPKAADENGNEATPMPTASVVATETVKAQGAYDDAVLQSPDWLKQQADALPSGNTRSGEGKPTSVEVHSGDTLETIAARPEIYHSPWLYPLIQDANRVDAKDADHPRVGAILTVPRDVADSEVLKAKEEAFLAKERAEALAVKAKQGRTKNVHSAPKAATAAAQAMAPSPVPTPTHRPRPVQQPHGLGFWKWFFLGLAAIALLFWFKRDKEPR
jgi:hypothetical protein